MGPNARAWCFDDVHYVSRPGRYNIFVVHLRRINDQKERAAKRNERRRLGILNPALSHTEFFNTRLNSLHRDRHVGRHLGDKWGGNLQGLADLGISEENRFFCWIYGGIHATHAERWINKRESGELAYRCLWPSGGSITWFTSLWRNVFSTLPKRINLFFLFTASLRPSSDPKLHTRW